MQIFLWDRRKWKVHIFLWDGKSIFLLKYVLSPIIRHIFKSITNYNMDKNIVVHASNYIIQ